jgi:hypothetical protein
MQPRTLHTHPLIIPVPPPDAASPPIAEAGSKVSLQVNKLWSAKTQLTYSYYSLPFCKPDVIVEEKENLGQVSNECRGDAARAPGSMRLAARGVSRWRCRGAAQRGLPAWRLAFHVLPAAHRRPCAL